MASRSIHFIDQEADPERLLSKSDISSIESDESETPPPPTIPIRKRSLVERRNVQLTNVIIGDARPVVLVTNLSNYFYIVKMN